MLAAVGLTVAVAACGGGSTSAPVNTPSASNSAVPAPNPGGGVAGSLLNAPAGNGGSAPLGSAGTPKLTTVHPQSVSVAPETLSHTTGGAITNVRSGISIVKAGAVSSGAARNRGAARGSGSARKTPSKPASSTEKSSSTPSAPTRTTPTRTVTQPSAPPKTIVHTVYRPVYRTKVKTVIRLRTVIRTVRPKAPSVAFLPSTHQALALRSFTVQGSNVGCAIGAGGVRCSIQRRVWAAPRQPTRCRTTWGNTVSLQAQGPARFVCGGSSALSPNAQVIPDGWDDKVGNVTCQVRGIGVDCFSKRYHGFIISRTGYATY